MKTNNKPFLMSCLTLSFVFLGCGAEANTSSQEMQIPTTNTSVTLPTSYKADAGRLLGSQCAQCHGTNGISVTNWDSIAGEGDLADEIFGEAPIMDAQAHGYTIEEIMLIGDWLATLSKNSDDNDEESEDDD
jgi:mono/diheme cytochrome c family protein